MKKTNHMDDNQLVRSCLQGELEDFKKIMDKYRGKAMAMALSLLGNREDAEDACQDAFMRIYRDLRKFDFQKNFHSWLYTILYNRCLDLLRKKHRFQNFFKRMKSNSVTRIEVQPSNPSIPQKMSRDVFKELSPKERISLFLWANEGYTSDERAQVLKCSSSTARVHLFKARKKIKKILERKDDSM